MPPWIKIDGDLGQKFRPLVVNDSQEATRLKDGDAQQVMRAATDEYPAHAWKVVPIGGFPDYFVVEGFKKK
jgi:hypothetical protein